MRIGRVLAISLFWFGLAACGHNDSGSGGGGGDGGGGGPPRPVDHMLAQGQPATFAARAFYGFEFLLPAQATVHFSASETTTDTWNVALFTPTEWLCYQDGSCSQAYGGVHNDVMQVSDTVDLPKGDWYLGFRCNNLIQRCMLVFNLDAVY